MDDRKIGEIIEKAMSDAGFRGRLMEDAAAALASYDLTDEEFDRIASTLNEQFDGVLEPRLSKRRMGKFGSMSGPMGIDGAVE